MSWLGQPEPSPGAPEASPRLRTACKSDYSAEAYGSMPKSSIDPVVMAAATVMRLQTIVSREIAATEAAVVTVGVLQAGTKENVIPDEAIIKLNVRTFDEGVRKRVLAAIERIATAEAAASGAPKVPEI